MPLRPIDCVAEESSKMMRDEVAPRGAMEAWPGLSPYARSLETSGNGDRLFYFDSRQQGRRALILIHGLGDEADSWRHIFPLLAPRYRLLAPDLPGFGRSTVHGRTSLGRCAKAVLELMAAEELSSAVLVGSSLGAAVAQRVASMAPSKVSSLVFVDGGWPAAGGGDGSLLFSLLPFRGERRYTAYRRDHEAAVRSLAPYYADFDALPESDRSFLARRVIDRVESDGQRRAYFSLYRSAVLWVLFRRTSFRAGLAGFDRPLLVAWGSEDRILSAATAELLCSIAPRARSFLLEGAGHLPQQERPEELAAAIEAFLDDADAPGIG